MTLNMVILYLHNHYGIYYFLYFLERVLDGADLCFWEFLCLVDFLERVLDGADFGLDAERSFTEGRCKCSWINSLINGEVCI